MRESLSDADSFAWDSLKTVPYRYVWDGLSLKTVAYRLAWDILKTVPYRLAWGCGCLR